MNTVINGSGGLSTGMQSSMSISVGTQTISSSVKKSSRERGKLKKLNYNPREISSAILQATKAQSAGRVLTRARGKLGSLMKCRGIGMYDETELNSAILHAKRMVRCAQMKTKNLKLEEQMQKQNQREHGAESSIRETKGKPGLCGKSRDSSRKPGWRSCSRLRNRRDKTGNWF